MGNRLPMPAAAPTTDLRSIPAEITRSLELDFSRADVERRTVPLSLTSEAPQEDFPGVMIILDHTPEAVMLDRIRRTGTFLWNHQEDKPLGRLDDVRLDGKRTVASARFSKNAFADEIWRDVQDGILRSTSARFRVHKAEFVDRKDGVTIYRATKWELKDGSIVTVPADFSVGVGRSANHQGETPMLTLPGDSTRSQKPASTMETSTATVVETTPKKETPAVVPVVPNADSIRSETRNAEHERIKAIDTMAEAHKSRVPGVVDAARSAIREGKSLDDFRTWLLEDGYKAQKITTTAPSLAEMERDGKRSFSLCRVIASQDPELAKRTDLGFEREVSDALRKAAVGRARKADFTIPSEVLGIGLRDVEIDGRRTMQATTPSSGGYTIATDLQAGIITKLDNLMVVGRLGVRRLSGLQGNVTIVRQTGGATAYWVAENAAITDSELTFDLLALTPKTLGATSPISKQLIVQSSSDVEAFVRADLQKRLALAEDLAFFQGTGGSQPIGIFTAVTATTEGTTEAGKTTKVTYGAAATWADVVGIIADLAEANVMIDGSFAHVISPASWAKWATKTVDAGSGRFIWTGTMETGNVGGYRGTVSNHLPSDRSVSANWSNAMWAQWGGLDIVVDPYALKKQQALEVTVYDMLDFGHEHLEAFAVSTDSAAQ
jgi:HK97 family phage major capsid protein/HK97 family phage prohead protease